MPLKSICWRAHRWNLERVGKTQKVTGQTTKRLSHSFKLIKFVTAKSLAVLCYPGTSQHRVKTAKIEANVRCPPLKSLCAVFMLVVKCEDANQAVHFLTCISCSSSSNFSSSLQLTSCRLLLCHSFVSINRANLFRCTEMFRLIPVLLISLNNWFCLINLNLHI